MPIFIPLENHLTAVSMSVPLINEILMAYFDVKKMVKQIGCTPCSMEIRNHYRVRKQLETVLCLWKDQMSLKSSCPWEGHLYRIYG